MSAKEVTRYSMGEFGDDHENPIGAFVLFSDHQRIVTEMEAENQMLRKLLWLRHGCPIMALYGDDGEMQCCQCRIDFKRDDVELIISKWQPNPEQWAAIRKELGAT